MWCHVTDDAVDYGPSDMPGAWANVSTPAALPDEALYALGWRRYRLVPPPEGYSVTGSAREITATEVVDTQSGEVIAPPVPSPISRRQLLLALRMSGLISDAEAVAAAQTGALPASMAAIVATLPPGDAADVQITWAAMVEAERGHALWSVVIAAGLATDAEVDALFRLGATL